MRIYVHRTPTIMDGLVVRWNLQGDERREVSASRNGVAINGWWMFGSTETITEFQGLISEAWRAHALLKKGIAPARYENEVDVRFGETLAEVVARLEP